MKSLITLCFTVMVACGYGQAPKKTNTITVKNVSFDSAVIHLLDAGFVIDKKDEKFGTIQTEYKQVTEVIGMAMFVRIKDSSLMVTGKWFTKLFGNLYNKNERDLYNVEQGRQAVPKYTFNVMDEYAKSFGKEVEYSINK